MLVEVTYRAGEHDSRDWIDGFINTNAVSRIQSFGPWARVRMCDGGDELTIDEDSRRRLMQAFESDGGVEWI